MLPGSDITFRARPEPAQTRRTGRKAQLVTNVAKVQEAHVGLDVEDAHAAVAQAAHDVEHGRRVCPGVVLEVVVLHLRPHHENSLT